MAKKSQVELEFKVISDQAKSELGALSKEMDKSKATMKLEQAEMKNTGSEQDKLTSSLKYLETAYASQGQKVDVLTQAMSEAKRTVGENSDSYAKLEKQLMQAKTYQANLAASITDTSQSLGVAKGSITTYGSAMDNLNSEQKNLSASASVISSEYKKWQATAGQTATESEKLARAEKYVADQSEILEQKITGMKQALSLTQSEFGETSTEALSLKSDLAKVETEFAELSNSAKSIDTTNLDDIGSKIDLANIQLATDAIAGIGDKIIGLGSAGVDATLEMKNMAFGVSQSSVQMGLSMDDAKSHIKDIAATGVGSFDEVGEAVKITVQQLKGLDEADLNTVTESGLNLEKVFGADMDETMRGANALMEAYGMSATEAIDMITAGSQRGLDKTHELGDNLAEYAPLMAENGIASNEYFGMLENGLDSGAYNADKVNDVIKEMGVKMNDGSVRKGLEDMGTEWTSMYDKAKEGGKSNAEIMKLVQDKIGKLPDETKRASAESAIWGSLAEDNGTKVMNSLFKTNDAYKDVSGSAKKLNDEGRNNTEWEGSLNRMKSALEKVGETIMENLKPVLDFVATLAEGFGKLPGPVQGFILALAGIAAVVAVIAPVIAGFMALGAILSGPIIAIIAGVVAAVMIVIAVFKNWGAITDWIKEIWELFKSWLSDFWEGIKSLFSTVLEGIKTVIQFYIDLWVTIFTTVMNVIKTVFTTAWDIIKSIFSAVLSAISTAIQFYIDTWVTIITTVMNVIKTVISTVWNGIKTVFTTVLGFIKNVISTAWNNIKTNTQTIFNAVKSVISTVWNGIKSVINTVVGFIKNVISTAWNNIKNNTQTVFNSIKSVASSVWNGIKSTISNVVNGVKNIVSKVWNSIKSVTSSVFNAIKSVASNVWNGIKSTISNVVNGVKNVISNTWNTIKSTTSRVFDGIKSAMTKPIEAAKGVVSGIINKIKGLFNFKLKFPSINIPKIPLPHFSLTGSFNPLKGKIPKIGIDWYAKGGIMTKPTAFGSNGNSIMGGGEAGREAILPLNYKNLSVIGQQIADTMRNSSQGNTTVVNINAEVRNDTDIKGIADKVISQLTRKTNSREGAWS